MKRIAVIALVLVLLVYIGISVVAYLYGISLREAGMREGMWILRIAAQDLATYGYVTNVSSTAYKVSLSTKAVTIGGTQYQCYAEIGGGKFYDEGTLGITTNQTFIWLDRKHPAKIVGRNYRAPLFPPHF
jgi:hypothetical protein